jgi:hypothetical protein
MDSNLILVFLCIFFVFGAGGTLFWRMKQPPKNDITTNETRETSRIIANSTRDALLSPWKPGTCKTLSGTCGKGQMNMTRTCVQDGSGNGQRCSDAGLSKIVDCYVQCSRPSDVVDWGHLNDFPSLPVGSPMKGWYDISGQGQPNDYCRWVGGYGKAGAPSGIFWACQSEKDPYVKTDPGYITFSAGPANRLIPYHPALVERMCPGHTAYLMARDPDLQRSIANGFMARCGARCVYDHRNPKNGWWFNGTKWERIENMIVHPCSTRFKEEMDGAIGRYEKLFDVRNAWTV